jgi:hypothetical protein
MIGFLHKRYLLIELSRIGIDLGCTMKGSHLLSGKGKKSDRMGKRKTEDK